MAETLRGGEEYAREGFPLSRHYQRLTSDDSGVLAADARSAKVFLTEKALGALIRQPDLARTLEEIAVDGPETFYRGRLAKRLADGMRAAGVLVNEADLAACQAQVQDPIGIRYRGFQVTQTPPNSTGFTMLQILKIAERFDLVALDPVRRIRGWATRPPCATSSNGDPWEKPAGHPLIGSETLFRQSRPPLSIWLPSNRCPSW